MCVILRLVSSAGRTALAAALAVLFASACAAGSGSGRPDRLMAVTFDDLPVAPPGRHTTAQQAEITDRLLEVLDAHDVPANGFVNELSPARPLVVDRVEVRQLTSGVNGVDYELDISLPHGYEGTDRRFPVVYTLDAGYSFLIARNITDHLAERGHLDEVIVVSIAYAGAEPGRSDDYRAHRTRDYTPTHTDAGGYGPEFQKASGGGPRFLEALATEIIPAVDRSYRTVPGRRILVGHSYGGLFTLWAMLSKPDLFSGWIAVSPSIWYDDHNLLGVEEAYAEHHHSLPGRAYLCVGSREHNSRIDMVGDLRTLVDHLESRGYQGLELESLVMADETHNSVFPGCLSNGLRFVLEGR